MNPLTLQELQHWMKSRIRAGEVPFRAGTEGLVLNPQRGSPGADRLAVYAEGYLVRTQEALAEVYEAVKHVLGPRTFAGLSRAYAQRYPSHDYNLNFVGRHLPEFLTTYPLTQQLAFLPDLARLEWLVCRAFHAFAQAPLELSRMSSVSLEDWDRVRLIFQSAVGLVASAWPILDIWEARQRPVAEATIDVVNRPQRVLVFRQGVQVRCELVDEWHSALLEGLLAGRTVGTVCRDLAERAPHETLPVKEWFARWTQAGLIVRCERP